MGKYILSRKHSMLFFFQKCWLEVKTRIHRGLAQYTGKISLHHFWKLKFCCSTLSTACLAATPIPSFLSETRGSHLISPLLSRLPNILRRFYSSSHVRASSWQNQHFHLEQTGFGALCQGIQGSSLRLWQSRKYGNEAQDMSNHIIAISSVFAI